MGDLKEPREISTSHERSYLENDKGNQDTYSTLQATEHNANTHFEKNENININKDSTISMEICKDNYNINKDIKKDELNNDISTNIVKNEITFREECLLSPIKQNGT